jgi:hypothetical protein
LPEVDLSLAEWISVLKLSTMWEFTGSRQYAISQITKLGISPARQINLARDYHIQEWFLPGLIAYAQQQDAITADDVDLLGWDFVLKLLQARERMGNFKYPHESRYMWYTPTIEARVTHDFTTSIEVVFGDEIERVRQICAGRSIGQMLHSPRTMGEKEDSVLLSERHGMLFLLWLGCSLICQVTALAVSLILTILPEPAPSWGRDLAGGSLM